MLEVLGEMCQPVQRWSGELWVESVFCVLMAGSIGEIHVQYWDLRKKTRDQKASGCSGEAASVG